MPVSETLRAALADRYAVAEEIGRGGMATVFEARDLRHDRPVAIKVLSEEASAARGADRFLREIRVVAGLNHPHILPLFDSGDAAGRLYFVMPFVRGESLRQRLRRDEKLPIDEALRIAWEIGDALAHAHDAGVIHRDVKPENILLSHGHALLADFGISRAATPQTHGETLTQTGMIVGTPEYMSPEQLVGEDNVGPASDVYALGCVIHEMLTGEPPHAGGRLQALIAERLSAKALDLRSRRPEVTISMERSLSRALAPNPTERFSSPRDFVLAFTQRAADDPAAGTARSLIARPFDPVGDDSDLAFFCDGLTEEVIGALSKIRSMRVISRTSAMRLKGTTLDVRSIGRDYDVRYVITGSVRRAGAKVRVAAEIADSLLDTPVWSGKFDGTVEDPFGIQEAVASGIVEALQVSLTPEEQRRMAQRPIADPRAYECYRKAMAEIVTFSREGLERAESLLTEGLSIVGDNAQIFAGLGSVHWQYLNAGIDVSDERLHTAMRWAERALAIDPDQPGAHTLIAWIHGSRGRMLASITHLERALAIEPTNSFGLAFLGVVDWITGRDEHLRIIVQRQQAIDPWELWGVIVAGVVCALDGDRVGRDRYFQRALEISAGPFVVFMHGHVLVEADDRDGARRAWAQFATAAVDDLGVIYCQAGLAALDGRTDDVRLLLTREDSRTLIELDAQWGWFAASLYSLAGLQEAAIDTLEIAVRQGFSNVQLMESRDATLVALRNHPRYAGVVQRARESVAALERALDTGGGGIATV